MEKIFYLHFKFKEPGEIVRQSEDEDEDDKEPAMAIGSWLEIGCRTK